MSADAGRDLLPSQSDPEWIEGHNSESLDDFLRANPPSKGLPSQAWIWVRRKHRGSPAIDAPHMSAVDYEAMTTEAVMLTSKLEADCKRIQDDASIPLKSSKAKGLSKKAHRETLHRPFLASLRDVAARYNETSGKLLFFWDSTVVDANFATLARAMVNPDGAFHDMPVFCVKVAAVPNGPEAARVCCLYLVNSYDRDAVRRVWMALMRDVGLSSKSYKTNIMTLAGVNSGHPSGLKTTLYSQSDMFTKEEVEALFAEKKGKVVKSTTAIEENKRGQDFANSDTEDEDDARPPPKKSKP